MRGCPSGKDLILTVVGTQAVVDSHASLETSALDIRRVSRVAVADGINPLADYLAGQAHPGVACKVFAAVQNKASLLNRTAGCVVHPAP